REVDAPGAVGAVDELGAAMGADAEVSEGERLVFLGTAGTSVVAVEPGSSAGRRRSCWASTLASGPVSIGRGLEGPGPRPPVRARPRLTIRAPATAMATRMVRRLRTDQPTVADSGTGSGKDRARISSGRRRDGRSTSSFSSATLSFCGGERRLPMARPGDLDVAKCD